MVWLLFGATLISAVFAGYQMVVSYERKTISLQSDLASANARVLLLTSTIRMKNEYISKLERATVNSADPDTISRMLNDIFLREDSDGDGDQAMSGERSAD